MKTIGIIPTRLESTRLPGKALMEIAGKPMIQHVWERASCSNLDRVIVATDSVEIVEAARRFGALVEMTSSLHESGTGRVVELAKKYEADFYVNIQGDEPLIAPGLIDDLVEEYRQNPDRHVLTAVNPSCSTDDFYSPNVVKVVVDNKSDALYFSRSPIPYTRDTSKSDQYSLKHIGIYGYTSEALEIYENNFPGQLEQLEKLEQLRFLEAGMKIKVIHTSYESLGVDTMEDLVKIRNIIETRNV